MDMDAVQLLQKLPAVVVVALPDERQIGYRWKIIPADWDECILLYRFICSESDTDEAPTDAVAIDYYLKIFGDINTDQVFVSERFSTANGLGEAVQQCIRRLDDLREAGQIVCG